MSKPDSTHAAHNFLTDISEPIQPIDESRIVSCPTCTGDRDFDDPSECPDCAGERTIVI